MRPTHDILSSPEKRKKKRTKLLIKAGVITSAILLVFGLGIYGLHSDRIRISDIVVEGERVVAQKEIIDMAQKELEGSYMKIFPKDGIFFYPKEKIIKSIAENFGRISDVEVRRSKLTALTITVVERDPTALWCGKNIIEDEGSITTSCYFVDETGLIFAPAPHFSGSVYFKYYSELLGGASTVNPIDRRFLSREDFTKTVSFVEELNKVGLKTYQLLIDTQGAYEFFLGTGAGKVVVNPEDDYVQLLRNLQVALETKQAEREEEDIALDLEYIDLRFDNKVLFKFYN